jgi:hypothetical protein
LPCQGGASETLWSPFRGSAYCRYTVLQRMEPWSKRSKWKPFLAKQRHAGRGCGVGSPGRAAGPALAPSPGVRDTRCSTHWASDGAHKQPPRGQRSEKNDKTRDRKRGCHRKEAPLLVAACCTSRLKTPCPGSAGGDGHRTYGVHLSTPQLRLSDATTRSLAERGQSDGPCMSCVCQGPADGANGSAAWPAWGGWVGILV